MTAWHARSEVVAAMDAMRDYAAGAPLAECPVLEPLVHDPKAAQAFVGDLVETVVEQMRLDPLVTIPMRFQYEHGYALVQVAAQGPAALALTMHDGFAFSQCPKQQTIAFVDAERHEVCLAGKARIRLVTRSGGDQQARFAHESREFEPGDRLVQEGSRSARMFDSIDGRLVTLRLSRTANDPEPSREFRIDTGELVHRASGDRKSSRRLMALTVLARTKHPDAVPRLVELTHSGDPDVRWQALRECLALDTAIGFTRLCAIAREPSDPLAGNAAALRAQLVARYPQLAELEREPCPA
ncbi:HEAT repeat domain-containing protein [Tsuneonella mangrovi]|uniref:HEAT repeat domain-containing protein n=1 Tax=Tsuneonella mangrovi TaxID=1982042 RepID=UPI00196B22EA|nr:HEAT repeat domain-containing protein [Tsuneonella mangrovi]